MASLRSPASCSLSCLIPPFFDIRRKRRARSHPHLDASNREAAGYTLYYGTASGTYTETIDVGWKTVVKVPNLAEGNTYYFVVKAYDSDRVESLPSNEATFTAESPGGGGGGEQNPPPVSLATIGERTAGRRAGTRGHECLCHYRFVQAPARSRAASCSEVPQAPCGEP
jgi:hypothetical protein